MLMPAISRYMTREPHVLPSKATAAAAHDLMRSHQIRHLPIVDGDRLIGLVGATQLETLASMGTRLEALPVTEVMTAPVTVWASQTLEDVAELMKREKCDCVVVLGGQGVQGIFTAIDALEALGRILAVATA